MPRIILITTIFFCFLDSYAQPVRIEATVNQLPVGRVFLSQIRGEEHKIIDSLIVSGGVVRYNLKDPLPGVYRITLGKSLKSDFYDSDPQFFDIIVNAENTIILKTDFNHPFDSMKIITSEENQLYYSFLKINNDYKNKAGHVLPLFSVYSPEDSFYVDIKNEFTRLQRNFTDALMSTANKKPGSLASSMIMFNLLPAVDPSAGFSEMTGFLKTHYFDLVTFTDERLINSQAYTQKILEFMSFYRNSNMTQTEQEDKFIEAVDVIMERASYNEQVFDFILNFLVDGFDRFKMEKVLVYLAENYVEKGCETDSKKIMEQRLEGYKRMAVGNSVNDIVLLDEDGKSRRLSELKNEYVLVLFWASWCPHCTRLLPEIKKWYETERNIDLGIFSVSIDTSRFDWEEHLLLYDYPWINVCSLQGWEGKVASDYNIYASPTMFLIDRNRKILGKPLTFREFRREVEKLGG